jgi:hypothetical protein
VAGLWKSLFGSEEPQGSLDDAMRLLYADQIEPGRRLLRAICRREPSNVTAHVLSAFELSRPPADWKARYPLLLRLEQIDPDRTQAEFASLMAFLDVLLFEGDTMIRAYERIPGHPPSNPHCAAIYLTARLMLSDVILQVKFLPRGESMTALVAHPAAQGAAQFVLRDARALPTLQRGIDAPERMVRAYEDYLKRSLLPAERADVCDSLAFECNIGRGLVFRDQNRMADARAAFSLAAKVFAEVAQREDYSAPLRVCVPGPDVTALRVLLAEQG